ncbi:TOPRIM nucleotidyl transferase/hydrolase domain-containing protein [Streptomyces griseus]|uniref:TOPRIM nucleotidyl transferase/hydrolase domain-containing protein n=1 Tax=Streptomyces griseus TaxID=1911 RepID=UPI00084078EB|nr:TOPRIM nucleotidyl transferase/hydrolase domain-containing protein [Streptomyces griseus]
MADMRSFRDAVTSWAWGGPADPAYELAALLPVRGVVLVEGPSDVAAVEALAHGYGRDLAEEEICVLAMGGAMNVARFVDRVGPGGLNVQVTGLCDEGERGYFARAWARAGLEPSFFVCDVDLEDELIRALGVERVTELVRQQGDLRPLLTLQSQPAQRERTTHQQLRRFIGTKKGRKIHYGTVLVEALPHDLVPPPLRDLIDFV